jgi:hypothetical protein
MSLDHYHGLTDNCAVDSVEFAILQKGVIVGHLKDGHYVRTVEILCELEQAKKFWCSQPEPIPTPFRTSKKLLLGHGRSRFSCAVRFPCVETVLIYLNILACARRLISSLD